MDIKDTIYTLLVDVVLLFPSGSSPTQKMTKVTDGVASLQIAGGGDG